MSKPIAESVISPRLRHRLAEIETLVAQDGDSIMVCEAGDLASPYPRIVSANEQQCRLTGYPLSAMLGQTPRLFQSEETSPETKAEIRAALANRRKIRIEILNRSREGERYWVEMDIVPVIDPDSGLLFFISFQRDVTRRKRLEQEHVEARARAERAMSGRADFIAAVVRELGGSLNAALGSLELLERGPAGAEQRPLIAAAIRSVRDTGDFLAWLPDIARIDAGASIPGPASALALADFLDEMRLQFMGDASRRGLHFEASLAAGLPSSIEIDIPHLRQLVSCLIEQALRQTASGGIALTLEGEADQLCIDIHDSGTPGPADALLPALAARIAATLGATIESGTSEGAGSTCHVALPCPGVSATDRRPAGEWRQALRSGAQMAPPGVAAPPSPMDRAVAHLRALVASADPLERATLARQLQALGARVDIVANGAQALILATSESPYDLILADLHLPVVTGADFVRGLRTHEEAHGLPRGHVVGMAEQAAGPASDEARVAGMDRMMAKPLALGQLVDLLSGGADEMTSTLPPIDVPALKSRLDLVDDLDLAAVLAVVAETLDQLEADLAAAVDAHDGDRALDSLHVLAGEAKDIEARPLLSAIGPCRLAVGNGDWNFATRTFHRLTDEIARLRQAMDAVLGLG
ncbi:PAS domain-containing protein [Zavarzinia sp.]|uniref:PAS domain-containing sensor histidine kinase n=1 Tax=Zavarzinia sp. TaxID=2027920 RepID=UPI003BB628BA|nr:PAS domain-containing protein [Zavarzinia sp.]